VTYRFATFHLITIFLLEDYAMLLMLTKYDGNRYAFMLNFILTVMLRTFVVKMQSGVQLIAQLYFTSVFMYS